MLFFCRKDIDYYCVMHVTGNRLFSQSKGRPTKSDSRQKLKCSQILNEKILELRKDFSLHDDTKMLVMLSISTNDMNRYVSLYPEVWFIDCTSGETEYLNCYICNRTYDFVYTISYIIVSNSSILFRPLMLSRHKPSKETIVCYGCPYSKWKNTCW